MAPPSDATHVLDAQKKAPADIKAVANFLRGKNGPKVRRGVLNGKRVDYFKSKTAVRTLLGPAYQKLKKVPPVTNEEEAKAVMIKLISFAFFLRTEKAAQTVASGQPKPLLLSPQQSFDDGAIYAWFYDGSPLLMMVAGVGMVAAMLAAVMFPLWPARLRVGVYYLSLCAFGLIGAIIVIAIVRLILWCITVVSMKRAIWIFPNLFEDVGFIDSFIPFWAYDEPKKKKKRVDKRQTAAGEADAAPAADAAEPTATSTAVDSGTSNAGVRHRQAATIEEIPDDGN